MPDNCTPPSERERTPDDSIGRLIRRIEIGDDPAFEALANLSSGRIMATYLHWYANRPHPASDGDDLAQALLLKLWQSILAGKLSKVHSGRQYWHLISRAVKRRIFMRHERDGRQKRGAHVRHTADAAVLAGIPSGAPAVEAVAAFAEERSRLIALLPDDQWRRVADLWLDEYTWKEIADVLNISQSTVGRRLHGCFDIWRADAVGLIGITAQSVLRGGGGGTCLAGHGGWS